MEFGCFMFLYLAAVIIFSSHRVVSHILDDSKPLGNLGIINGKKIPIRKMPYIAALECYNTFVNGAIIIKDQYVITYSENHPDASECQIRTGSADRLKGGSTYLLSFSTCIAGNFENSICVDKVKSPFEFNDDTKPIELSDKGVEAGDVVTIGGWGVTSARGPPSDVLRAKTAKVIDLDTCLNSINPEDRNSLNSVGCLKNGTVSFGDFGGPVVYKGKAVGLILETFPFYEVPYEFFIDLTNSSIRDFINNHTNNDSSASQLFNIKHV